LISFKLFAKLFYCFAPYLVDLSLIERLWDDERIIKNSVHLVMTSPLARIESHPQEAKRLIGIDYEQFLVLVDLAEQRHLEKLAEIEKSKVRIIAPGGGRKPEISPKQGVCLCLVYLRQKPIFEILGLLFDISKTKANDTFNYWVEILREVLPASQMEEASKSSQKYE
jgi:hypothetical protein